MFFEIFHNELNVLIVGKLAMKVGNVLGGFQTAKPLNKNQCSNKSTPAGRLPLERGANFPAGRLTS